MKSAKSSMKSIQRKGNDSNMNNWENETFYEIANKVFISMKQHIESRNYVCDTSEVINILPSFKLNVVNHDIEKDEFSFIFRSAKNSGTIPTVLINDNYNTSSGIVKDSNTSCAKDMIVQQISEFCWL